MRRIRGKEIGMVFQDPLTSLNPLLTIGAQLVDTILPHLPIERREAEDRAVAALEEVGIPGAAERIESYPHEFSGGQRQRVCIARALALSPKFIVCDESVSALDVSVQAQVLNLLKELQSEFKLTYIFISHDLGVVKFMSDRIMVMNQGKIEEIGAAEDIYQRPRREYTQQLISAIPEGTIERIQTLQLDRERQKALL